MRSFDPRPDQLETISAIVSPLADEGARATAVLPCGYGKTFVAQQAAEQLTAHLPDALVLVAVPNLVLVDQMIRDWTKNASDGYAFSALPVNSRSGRRNEDEITGISIEAVTSDPEEISRFLAGTGRRVVFSTYQSMGTIAEALRKVSPWRPGFAFDLAIADEAHRTAGPVRGAEPSAYKTILDDGKIPARRRAFFTATPKVASQKDGSDEHPYSMDNVETFGPTVINRSLSWAQEQELLAEHDVFVVSVDDEGLRRLLEDNPTIRVNGSAEEARMVAAAIALAQTARQRSLGGIITYHSSIANAQAFRRLLTAVVDSLPDTKKPTGTLRVGHVNGSMPGDERVEQIALLDSANRATGDWAVVTNCSCLSEGVNIPSMDAVAFIDPRKSLIDIVQAVGRPLRRDPARPDKRATILVPAYIGPARSAEEAIGDGRFEAVFQVVKALADADEAFAAAFSPVADGTDAGRPAVSFQGPGVLAETAPGRPARVTIVSPDGWDGRETLASGADGDWASWHDSIKAAVFSRLREPWDVAFESFSQFVAANHRIPKFNDTYEGRNIGIWLNDQASKARKGQLPADRFARITAVSPDWLDGRYMAAFRRKVESLARFITASGRLPLAREAFEGAGIGQWLAKCRTDLRHGELSEDRKAEILAVAPAAFDGVDPSHGGGNLRAPLKRKGFDHMAEAFSRFVSEHGRIPTTHELIDDIPVGRWLVAQRTAYNAGRLPADRASQIIAISPKALDNRDQAAFEKGLSSLEAFVTREGRLPLRTEEHGSHKVGYWLEERRRDRRSGKLSPQRAEAVLAVAPTAFDSIGTSAEVA